jgi:hypothetical protein
MDEASALAADFEWIPNRIDTHKEAVHFVRLTREDHRRASFLSDEYIGDGRGRKTLTLAQVTAAAEAAPAGRCHFIFHSAFCCSTLLARAVDVDGRAMGLKEPYLLADLSEAALVSGSTDRVAAMLEPSLRLLARPFSTGEATVVKPSNVANPLIDLLLSMRGEARALFLYSPLPDYLRSIAKKGLWGRSWARNLFASLHRKPEFDAGFSQAQRWAQTDLQVAAMAWLQQQAQFARLLRQQPAGRIATLDSAKLLEDPARTMAAVSALFDLDLSLEQIGSIANGPIFASDSKRHDKSFDASARADEHARVEWAHGEEIGMVVRWAEAVATHVGVPLRLDAPLLS